MCALAWWTQEALCRCCSSAGNPLHLRRWLSGAGKRLSQTFFSAYGSRVSAGVSLLVGRSLDADVDVVFAGDGGQLVVVDVAVKSFKFRLVAVYAPNIAVERVSFFRRLAPFLDDTKRLVLMGDWNAILDPKIDKVGRGASSAGRCESSLVSFVTRHGLVDRFRLDHPGREMWMWLDSSPSAKVGSYLDRVLVRRADIDFVSCPTFHLIAWTDHKLVRVSLRLANRPSLAGYEIQYLLTGDTGLPEPAGIPNSAGVSGGGCERGGCRVRADRRALSMRIASATRDT